MDIPGGAAARAALSAMYSDTAVIKRSCTDAATNSMVTETVYDGVRCHLSSRKGLGARRTASLSQTAAQAQTNAGYTVFFDSCITVQPGDFLTVTHGEQTVRGRAGLADYGTLGVTVALDGVVIA
ncbi:hypothetical protein ACS3UN_10310 [Oscillospiraceae bacterium LTW-04]|nr:hypothetical protein RBH76_12060 [Oscillospiraceae bacterium MB24-C1]